MTGFDIGARAASKKSKNGWKLICNFDVTLSETRSLWHKQDEGQEIKPSPNGQSPVGFVKW